MIDIMSLLGLSKHFGYPYAIGELFLHGIGMQDKDQRKDQTPSIVRDLCEKLKQQLEQLNAEPEKKASDSPEHNTAVRKDLFSSLKDQLADLSR
jgi:hypothetical protein